MVKASLWVWVQVVTWLVMAVLASGSPPPMKGGASSKGSTVPQMASSSPSSPHDADDVTDEDSYDYEFGYANVHLLVAIDSAPRKIQRPCKPGYKPSRGKCRRVAKIERR